MLNGALSDSASAFLVTRDMSSCIYSPHQIDAYFSWFLPLKLYHYIRILFLLGNSASTRFFLVRDPYPYPILTYHPHSLTDADRRMHSYPLFYSIETLFLPFIAIFFFGFSS
jgi:hypothetical protein